jgi:tRNA dimethylallyltransferase
VNLVLVLGPTASGKSEVAAAAARQCGGEVVSGDAFAVYRGLDIGTAKPGQEIRASIPHHLIDIADPGESFSAGRWAREARCAVDEIDRRCRLPIVAGGSHFYIRAFLERLPGTEIRRDDLRRLLRERGGEFPALEKKRWLAILDPSYARGIPAGDTARLNRALEVILETGRRVSDRRAAGDEWLGKRRVLKLCLQFSRQDLYTRITERIDRMWQSGWPDEVRGLLARGVSPDGNAFRAIGYREITSYLAGSKTAEETRALIAAHTRSLVKRQQTWLASEPDLRRVRPEDATAIIKEFCRVTTSDH